MDYMLTFEDGSTGYLAHHGVKGMQWGVLNAKNAKEYAKYGRKTGGKKGTKAAKHDKLKAKGSDKSDLATLLGLKKKKKKKTKNLGHHNRKGTYGLTEKGKKAYADSANTYKNLRKARLDSEYLKKHSH